jgi:AcrR family transcriptional regulator
MEATGPRTAAVSRRRRALENRARMVEAGYELFCEQGYPATTVAEIAARAGVAVQTVYFTFGSKPGVLREAFKYAVLGDHSPNGPGEREWLGQLNQATDLGQALGVAIGAMATIIRRVAPLTPAVSMLADDPDVAAWSTHNEELRRAGYRSVVDALTRLHPLRHGLTADDATTILLTWLGPGDYRSMVLTHGWTDEKWRNWLVPAIATELFGVDVPQPRSRRRRGPPASKGGSAETDAV